MMTKELIRRGQDASRYDIELKPLPDNYQDGPLFIDASSRGNKTRFINHSCEPNCIFEKWQREGLPIIKVVAPGHRCRHRINSGLPLGSRI